MTRSEMTKVLREVMRETEAKYSGERTQSERSALSGAANALKAVAKKLGLGDPTAEVS